MLHCPLSLLFQGLFFPSVAVSAGGGKAGVCFLGAVLVGLFYLVKLELSQI